MYLLSYIENKPGWRIPTTDHDVPPNNIHRTVHTFIIFYTMNTTLHSVMDTYLAGFRKTCFVPLLTTITVCRLLLTYTYCIIIIIIIIIFF